MRSAALVLALALASCGVSPDQPAPTGDLPPASIRVIDGDTFVMDGETIRIANIDTPETPPRSRCPAEALLAQQATDGLRAVMLGEPGEEGLGGPYTLHREGPDRYGRTLATVSAIFGEDVGEEMIRRGLAVRWSGRRADWCTPGTPGAALAG